MEKFKLQAGKQEYPNKEIKLMAEFLDIKEEELLKGRTIDEFKEDSTDDEKKQYIDLTNERKRVVVGLPLIKTSVKEEYEEWREKEEIWDEKRLFKWVEEYFDTDDPEEWLEEHGFDYSDMDNIRVDGELNLNEYTEVELPPGLTYVKDLRLNGLTSAEGLELPEEVGLLGLNGLTSAEGLELPERVKWLFLYSLTSAEGLKLPKQVEILWLDGLTSAEGLDLDNVRIGDSISLNKLSLKEIDKLEKRYPHIQGKI